MKEFAKKLWIEALISGDYIQTNGVLNDDNGFCCLGVLCEVAIQNGLSIEKTEGYGGKIEYNNEDAELPYAVREWAGMNSRVGDLPNRKRSPGNSLIELNDDRNKSFKQIAETISLYWQEL